MTTSQMDIDKALIDVRKAYRVLHDFQRAALDASRYIGAQLGFEYRGGYSLFSSCAPKDGKGSLTNWSWDWLNLVFYDFHFIRKIGEKDSNLSIWLFSDTGYFISEDPSADKTDLATFAPVEVSATKIGFLLYRHWKDEFNSFRDSRADLRRFLETEKELPTMLIDGGVLGKCCSFCRIADEASTDTVIAELVQMAQANGFPLERIGKAC